jgi:predicted Zn-dependent protease
MKRIKESAFFKKAKESKAFKFVKEHKKVVQRTGSGAMVVLLLVILAVSIRNYNKSQSALGPRPQYTKEIFGKADEYMYSTEYDKAVQELLKLSEQGDTSALIRLCDVYALKGQSDEAKKAREEEHATKCVKAYMKEHPLLITKPEIVARYK